ncbi:hypothetical protein EYM_06125 [Ignicoccus islandicus DSM 13165]|uniref:Uncharacterized protein n=1 Tax=Ignicoccus islandicus DSM 13165 TaxID=940295 RepID=A0A0U3FT80_9CREN|nr:hypothetical protein EYM_06125 [Ignicoccus islandicus DSM 13165]
MSCGLRYPKEFELCPVCGSYLVDEEAPSTEG